jgi:hypothetical protein
LFCPLARVYPFLGIISGFSGEPSQAQRKIWEPIELPDACRLVVILNSLLAKWPRAMKINTVTVGVCPALPCASPRPSDVIDAARAHYDPLRLCIMAIRNAMCNVIIVLNEKQLGAHLTRTFCSAIGGTS